MDRIKILRLKNAIRLVVKLILIKIKLIIDYIIHKNLLFKSIL